jgi:hypothetical protein
MVGLKAREQAARDHRADRAAAAVGHADLLDDVVRRAVLHQVAGGAGLEALQHVRLVAEGGAHHDGAGRPRALRRADHLDARAVGQAQVDHQHVGRRQVEHGARFAAAAREAVQLQARRLAHGLGQRVRKDRVVFDDGDLDR